MLVTSVTGDPPVRILVTYIVILQPVIKQMVNVLDIM